MHRNKKYVLVLAFFVALLAPNPARAITPLLIGKRIVKLVPEQVGSYQGYPLHYQYFETEVSINDLIHYWHAILKLDVKIQKLMDQWLVSFEQENHHVLVQLLAFSETKTVGWWSALDMKNKQKVLVPDIISNVASQWWTYQAETDSALHIMFKTSLSVTALEQLIKKHLWLPTLHYCTELHACLWQKQHQQMRWWFDADSALWHARFWHVETSN